jgi:hypothetical protein
MIEQLSTRAADPTFRRSILPRAPNTCTQRLEITGSQEVQDVISELGIMVEQHVSIATGQRECFPQLLHDPIACWMKCNVECRMRRRLCSIAKKQYKVRNQRFGTVKKSNAAIASRWLFRIARQASKPSNS